MSDLNECCLSAEKYMRLPTDTARQLYLYTEWVGAFRCAPSFRIRRSDWDSCLLLYTLSGMGTLRTGGQASLRSAKPQPRSCCTGCWTRSSWRRKRRSPTGFSA